MAFQAGDPLPFTKMHGSGNDFVVIDNRDQIVAIEELPDFARAVCRRGLGLGADGVVSIERAESDDVDFHWRYLNADGSEGELCGNGAMCGARFAVVAGIAPASCRFSTIAGPVTAEVIDGGPEVRLEMADAETPGRNLNLTDAANVTAFDLVRVGVPHVVAVAPDVERIDGFDALGRAVREHADLEPAGANVNLIHRVDPQTIRMRTYERGVEAETLACGTGAVASAIVAAARKLVSQPVTVVTSSGRPLVVTWVNEGDRYTDIRLTGEARFVARGDLDAEGLI